MKYILLFLFLALGSTVFAQNITAPCSNCKFHSDGLGNLYLTENTTLKKYQNDDAQFEYNSNRLENFIVDVTNPFKITVFYPASGQLEILDNKLHFYGEEYNLWEMGLEIGGLFCNSTNNNFWFYNPSTMQLVKKDYQLNTIFETSYLNNDLPVNFIPTIITERNELLLLTDNDGSVVILDIYGVKKYFLEVEKFKHLSFDGKFIYLLTDNIYRVNIKTRVRNQLIANQKNIIGMTVNPLKTYSTLNREIIQNTEDIIWK